MIRQKRVSDWTLRTACLWVACEDGSFQSPWEVKEKRYTGWRFGQTGLSLLERVSVTAGRLASFFLSPTPPPPPALFSFKQIGQRRGGGGGGGGGEGKWPDQHWTRFMSCPLKNGPTSTTMELARAGTGTETKDKKMDKIQTCKRFKRTLIYRDTGGQSANFRGDPLRQATKRHLNNS